MRFAVVGAGAIGAYLGACLARAGLEVTLVARGAHLEAMREHGVRVIEPDGSTFTVHTEYADDVAGVAGAGCVFVTLKAHSLPAVAPALAAAADPEAALVFAQNGVPWWYEPGDGRRLESVDPGGVIAASIDRQRVVAGIAYPAATVLEPGVVRREEGDRFSLSELDGARSRRVMAIAEAMTEAGVRARVSSRIREETWVKLLGNATLNPVSALTGATVGEMLADPGTRELVRALMREVESVAGAHGLRLGVSVEQRLRGAAGLAAHRTSMLQDLESGRPLELDALVGAVVEVGDRFGVATPLLGGVLACVRLLERRRRGG